MEADWDLHAVVRGCSSSTSHPSVVPPSGSQFPRDQGSPPLVRQQPFLASRMASSEDLHDLYMPFFPKPDPFSWQNSPLSFSSSSSSLASSLFERTKSSPSIFGQVQRPSAGFRAGSQASKSKKRKNTQKKVCEVPAESVSSDVWAWRKYGQKPIKGSPFPRSYYRCSSSKGCLARKQVERNRSDSGMFIITYTAEHNHPAPAHKNSLAGVPRQKHQPSHSLTPPSEITSSDSNVQAATPCSSPNASPEEEEAVLRGGDSPDESENRAAGVEDTFGSDDFFAGLEGLTGDPWDPIQACFSFQWTAAAGGGVGS